MFWKKKTDDVNITNPMLVAFRVENTDGTLSIHLDPNQLGNASEAGVMLADIGRHMAAALSGSDGHEHAFNQIVAMFNAEANAPTQPVVSGSTHQGVT